jgi:hypothetical protein
LPYEGVYIDYDASIRQLPAEEVGKLADDILKMSAAEKDAKRKALEGARERFTWGYKEKPKAGQALWTLSWALYDRLHMIEPYLNNEMTGYAPDPECSILVT